MRDESSLRIVAFAKENTFQVVLRFCDLLSLLNWWYDMSSCSLLK